MSYRRNAPTDMKTIKRSRSSFTGAVTKMKDRLLEMRAGDPQTFNIRTLERALSSISNSETGFNQTVEEVEELLQDEDTASTVDQEEERYVIAAFQEHVEATMDMAENMLATKRIYMDVSTLRQRSQALRDIFREDSSLSQDELLSNVNALFSSIQDNLRKTSLEASHPLWREVDSFHPVISRLTADLETVRTRAAADKIPALSTSISSRETDPEETYRLPKLDVPTFHGDVMKWTTFWTQFEAIVDSNSKQSDVRKLAYLRRAIKNPEAAELLTTGAKRPGFYQEAVALLKKRFYRVREIHQNYCKKLIQLPDAKYNRAELRKLVDLVRATINNLKRAGQYDIESFLSSVVSSVLPYKLQTLWDQHSRKDKGVPPVDDLLDFVDDHAESLHSNHPTSGRATEPSEKRPVKKNDRKPEQSTYRQRSNVHVSSSSVSTYRWECFLCKPEKHPLFLCPKWESMTVAQCLGHIQTRKLCHNCLAVRHKTNKCKSLYKCRECGAAHHTSIHQDTQAAPINSSISWSQQLPSSLLMTAQVRITAPGGQTIQARALIDPGASSALSLAR